MPRQVAEVRRIGYITGRYPAASHAFIHQEVEGLRRMGLAVETISIRPALPAEITTDELRRAAETTFTVLPAAPWRLAGAHLRAFAAHPGRYLSTLALSVREGNRGARRRLWGLFYFAEAMVVWRHCRRSGIQHLHAHLADTGSESAMLTSAFDPAIGWSISVHGPADFANAAANRLAGKARRASFVRCISHFARAELISVAGQDVAEKVHVVHTGADLARFDRPAGSLPAAALHLVCVARLSPVKGQRLLIEAVAALNREGTEVTASLAGDGSERADLEARSRDLGVERKVRFLGWVEHESLPQLYASAGAVCLPSMAEGVPVVLMEAMAMGVPVIATDVGGVRELVEDGSSGLLVAPGSASGLQDAVRQLATDPALRERLGSAGQRRVQRDWDLRTSVTAMARLFQEPARELGPGPVGPG
jgi:glycosyltransferase involved in cell wall biosynthesis